MESLFWSDTPTLQARRTHSRPQPPHPRPTRVRSVHHHGTHSAPPAPSPHGISNGVSQTINLAKGLTPEQQARIGVALDSV